MNETEARFSFDAEEGKQWWRVGDAQGHSVLACAMLVLSAMLFVIILSASSSQGSSTDETLGDFPIVYCVVFERPFSLIPTISSPPNIDGVWRPIRFIHHHLFIPFLLFVLFSPVALQSVSAEFRRSRCGTGGKV